MRDEPVRFGARTVTLQNRRNVLADGNRRPIALRTPTCKNVVRGSERRSRWQYLQAVRGQP
jgi:hypothetical protein